MGERGPVPKRSEERLGHRAKDEKPTQAPSATPRRIPMPRVPELDTWHPLAKDWYCSLEHSGQSIYYEFSDWMTARMVAEQMSRELEDKFVAVSDAGEPIFVKAPIPGQSMNAILKAMSSLLVTEGDRRRASLELNRAANDRDEDAKILQLVRDTEREAFG